MALSTQEYTLLYLPFYTFPWIVELSADIEVLAVRVGVVEFQCFEFAFTLCCSAVFTGGSVNLLYFSPIIFFVFVLVLFVVRFHFFRIVLFPFYVLLVFLLFIGGIMFFGVR